jgi:uncharacterized protein YjbI with pentapeptide repeats
MPDWVKRWQSPEGAKLAEEVYSRIASSQTLDGLGLDLIDGRPDLRGLTLPAGPAPAGRGAGRQPQSRAATRMVRDARLIGLDLSDARLDHLRLFNCRVENCRFDRAQLDDLRIWGTTFVRSSFVRTRLTGATLGSGTEHAARNVWQDVDFSGASMRGAVVDQATFSGCDFGQAKIDKLEFRQCEIANCRFAGRLRDVIFYGRATSDGPASPPFEHVDLSAAVLDMCEFDGCRFVDSTFPADPDVRVVASFPEVGQRALEALRGDASQAAKDLKVIINHALHGPPLEPDAVYVLNRRDLHGYPAGEALIELADRLLV